MSKRKTTAGERALWRHVARSVRPLDEARMADLMGDAPDPAIGDTPVASETKKIKAAHAPHPVVRHVQNHNVHLPERSEPPGTGLDRRSRQKLKRGQLAIEARLDLHGHNRVAAQAALTGFVERSASSGIRCVLVITGKGLLSDGGGVLRGLLPEWLAEPPLSSLVLAHEMARAEHGGGGAFYLLLRRARQK